MMGFSIFRVPPPPTLIFQFRGDYPSRAYLDERRVSQLGRKALWLTSVVTMQLSRLIVCIVLVYYILDSCIPSHSLLSKTQQ